MLGQPRKLRIRTCASQDLGIARRDRAASFALKRSGEDPSSAASHARVDEAVYELDEIVWEANCDLLAHTIMVPNR
jgi:hypothetical protein